MAESVTNISGTTDKSGQVGREQFLRFVLLPDTNLMLSLSEIAAVLKIPFGEIVPIPEMPSWVIGVYNWRGEIIWMIDLGELLGFSSWYQQSVTTSNHKAIIIRPTEQNRQNQATSESVGLIVSGLNDIELCNPDQFHSPPPTAVTPELAPFLRGYWIKENGDIVVAVDGNAIFAAMPRE